LLGAPGVGSLYGNTTTQFKTFGQGKTEQDKTKSTQHKVTCSKYFYNAKLFITKTMVWHLPELGSCQSRVNQSLAAAKPEVGSDHI